MASEKIRILVLEDDDHQREVYADDVREFFADSEIDVAGNKDSAIEYVRNRTYHAALLDIMLTNYPDNTEGLDVLEYISSLNEGTRAVMLSASDLVEAPVRALRSRIAVDYIIKGRKSESIGGGLAKPDYITALETAVSDAHIPIFGSFGRLTSYLAAPEDPSIWEYNAISCLGAEGMESLSSFLSEFIKPLFPLLPLKNAGAMATDKERKACHAAYWSKVLGKPIWVCITHQGSEFHLPSDTESMIGDVYKKQKLKGAIWNFTADRSRFVERIWDVGDSTTT